MATKLIRLQDGILVEVEAKEGEVQQVAGGFAEKVEATFSKIKPILLKTCQPVAEALKEVRNQIELEQVEVELGLSFDGGGDIFIAKATLGANVLVRMRLKSK